MSSSGDGKAEMEEGNGATDDASAAGQEQQLFFDFESEADRQLYRRLMGEGGSSGGDPASAGKEEAKDEKKEESKGAAQQFVFRCHEEVTRAARHFLETRTLGQAIRVPFPPEFRDPETAGRVEKEKQSVDWNLVTEENFDELPENLQKHKIRTTKSWSPCPWDKRDVEKEYAPLFGPLAVEEGQEWTPPAGRFELPTTYYCLSPDCSQPSRCPVLPETDKGRSPRTFYRLSVTDCAVLGLMLSGEMLENEASGASNEAKPEEESGEKKIDDDDASGEKKTDDDDAVSDEGEKGKSGIDDGDDSADDSADDDEDGEDSDNSLTRLLADMDSGNESDSSDGSLQRMLALSDSDDDDSSSSEDDDDGNRSLSYLTLDFSCSPAGLNVLSRAVEISPFFGACDDIDLRLYDGLDRLEETGLFSPDEVIRGPGTAAVGRFLETVASKSKQVKQLALRSTGVGDEILPVIHKILQATADRRRRNEEPAYLVLEQEDNLTDGGLSAFLNDAGSSTYINDITLDNLRGVGKKAAEALGSAFPVYDGNVDTNPDCWVHLEGLAGLDDQGLAALSRHLSGRLFERLRFDNLPNVTPAGFTSFSPCLREIRCRDSNFDLYVTDCNLGDEGVAAIHEACMHGDDEPAGETSWVRNLDTLRLNGCSLTDKSLPLLLEITRRCPHLRNVDIEDNEAFTFDGMNKFAREVREMLSADRLYDFDLLLHSDSEINQRALTVAADPEKPQMRDRLWGRDLRNWDQLRTNSPELDSFSLDGSDCTEEDIRAVCAALASNTNLTEFSINEDSDTPFTGEMLELLLHEGTSRCSSLKNLEVRVEAVSSAEMMHALLTSSLPPKLQISFADSLSGSEGLVLLMDAIADDGASDAGVIEKLQLYCCSLVNSDLDSICYALSTTRKLKKLDISQNKFEGEDALAQLEAALRRNGNGAAFKKLTASGHGFKKAGKERFEAAIQAPAEISATKSANKR